MIAEKSYIKQNGGESILSSKNKNGEFEDIVKDIMGGNGEEFYKKWKTNFQ